MFSRFPELKSFLIRMRSRYSSRNTYKVSRKAVFQSKANIIDCTIIIPAHNTVHLAEGSRLKDLKIEIKGKNNEIVIHEEAFVVGSIELFGDNNRLEIGRLTRVTGALLAVHNGTKLTIGERCMFGQEIDIRTSDGHPIYNSDGEVINMHKDIEIHDRVWLAKGVAVLKGSVIEDDVVVGFRSVVAGGLPKNTVCAGMPAKVIKTGITWSRLGF